MYTDEEINELIEAWMFASSNDDDTARLYLVATGWCDIYSAYEFEKDLTRKMHNGGWAKLQIDMQTRQLSVCHAPWCSSVEQLMHEMKELKYYGV